jgi:hypothetical protein
MKFNKNCQKVTLKKIRQNIEFCPIVNNVICQNQFFQEFLDTRPPSFKIGGKKSNKNGQFIVSKIKKNCTMGQFPKKSNFSLNFK